MMQGVLKGGNLKQVEIVLNGITHTLLFACITQEFRRVSCGKDYEHAQQKFGTWFNRSVSILNFTESQHGTACIEMCHS